MSSLVAPGNDSEPGAVNALACAALDGWVWMPSMIGVGIEKCQRLGTIAEQIYEQTDVSIVY